MSEWIRVVRFRRGPKKWGLIFSCFMEGVENPRQIIGAYLLIFVIHVD